MELLDDADTRVPQQTARGLLLRATPASVRVFLLAEFVGVDEDAGAQGKAELRTMKGWPRRLASVLEGFQLDEDPRVAEEASWARAQTYFE